MSPSYVNDKKHPVRVKDETGALQRVLPGQVVDADGKYADNLAAAGLASASDDDARSWENERARRAGDVTDGQATRLASKLLLSPIRLAARMAVAAPLRRVVGDDAAPFGPPSGTITTKAEAASKNEREREAFADFEALPGEKIASAGTPNPNLPIGQDVSADEIHNAQVRNAEIAESLAVDLIEEADNLDVARHYAPGEPSGSDDAPAESDDEMPDALPDNYDDLNAEDAEAVVAGLDAEDREQALAYERSHKDRAFAKAE